MAMVYGPASAAQIASATARPRRKHHWATAVGVLVAAIVVLNVIAQLSVPATGCTSNCPTPPPPKSPPVSYGTVYHSSRYGFTLAYSQYAGSPTSMSSGSIAWAFALKSGGYLDAKVFGSSSQGGGPIQAVAAAQSGGFSQFRAIYSIPDAEVGYVRGAGEVYEGQWTPLIGSSSTERLAITSAIKNGVTVTVVCEAPKTSDNGEHPDPSQLSLGADQFCDEVGNTVAWKP